MSGTDDNAAKVYETDEGKNFDYLLKIINLTDYKLEKNKKIFISGKVGGNKAYTFCDIEPFGFFKSKMCKDDNSGNLLGYVRYKIENLSFDIAFSNPKKGNNSLLVENVNQTGSGGENCISRVNVREYKDYCNLSHDSSLEDVYYGKDQSGMSVTKWIKFDNIIDENSVTYTSQGLNDKLDKNEKHFDLKIPLIIRYGVTPTEKGVPGVAVVMIDIDKEQVIKNEDVIKESKDKYFNVEKDSIDKTIQDSEDEQKVLGKILPEGSTSEEKAELF